MPILVSLQVVLKGLHQVQGIQDQFQSHQSVGIHSYDSNSIDNSSGLDKKYKEFWNAQALEPIKYVSQNLIENPKRD